MPVGARPGTAFAKGRVRARGKHTTLTPLEMRLMKLFAALTLGGLLCTPATALFHGGTYVGPGDTVPPGGGGGGGAGSGPSPGTGGPSRPTTPGPGDPGPPTGGPTQPGTGQPGPAAPITGGGGPAVDFSDWQYWWAFNRAPYLDLKSKVQSGTRTGDAGFFLGQGQSRARGMTFAPSRAVLDEKVLPALLDAIANERDNDMVTAALIAVAKIGDTVKENGESAVRLAIKTRLADPVQEIRETAVLSLGIQAAPASLDDLLAIARDDHAGRRLVGKPETPVNGRTRSFAVYGLGLLGHANSDPELRREVVQTLIDLLQGPRQATRDLKVAAAIASGIVPVEALERTTTEEAGRPSDSRRDQIEALLAMHVDSKSSLLRDVERAHLARAMVLLCDGVPEDLRISVGEALIDTVGMRTRKETVAMRQSAVLALGTLGDCDGQELDVAIRAALARGLSDPDQLVQRFSLISMGRVGGRVVGGESLEAQGRKELRATLAKQLAKGRQRRPWAALAIGVMERDLADAGAQVSSDQLGALTSALETTRSGHDVAAYSLALGIAHAQGSAAALVDQLDSQSDDAVRGHIAVGLGLMEATAATEQIQEVLAKSKYRARLLEQAAMALGLLGDRGVASQLAHMLREDARSLASQAAIASALGFIGDSGSIDPLLEMLADDKGMTDRARAFAIAALGIVGDKELLPWNAKLSVDLNYRATASTLVEGGKGVIEIL